MTYQNTLLNFRIPTPLKDKFQDVCKQRNTAMTSILIELVNDYINKHQTEMNDTWEPIVWQPEDFDEPEW